MKKSGVFIKRAIDLTQDIARSTSLLAASTTNLANATAGLAPLPALNDFQQASNSERSVVPIQNNGLVNLDNGTVSASIETLPAALTSLGIAAGSYIAFAEAPGGNTIPSSPSTENYISGNGTIRITTAGRYIIHIKVNMVNRSSGVGSTADVPIQVYVSSDGAAATLAQYVPGRSFDESGLGGLYGNDPTIQTIVKQVNVSEEIVLRVDAGALEELSLTDVAFTVLRI